MRRRRAEIQKQEPEFLFSRGGYVLLNMNMMKARDHRPSGLSRSLSNEERWKAVLRRDAKADGSFYYSVRTTGIYCRPSCAARRPLRKNVQFHASCAEAEGQGFRACRRCQPNGIAPQDKYAATVAAACRAIETAEEAPSLAALARAAGLSRFHFHRVFTKIAGITPKGYATARRAERLREMLPGRRTVTQAIYDAGFNASSRFYAQSSRLLGMAPKQFRDGGSGAVIRYAVGKCSLGAILVAMSNKGVCAILMNDRAAALRQELRTRFPRAELVAGDKGFARIIRKVLAFVEEPRRGLDLPLDVHGTAFQRRVWEELQRIPTGETASYTAIAEGIGAPRSVRAVARACAANVIAVAIPCHRVVRAGGQLSGYRWGLKRKHALLAREREQS